MRYGTSVSGLASRERWPRVKGLGDWEKAGARGNVLLFLVSLLRSCRRRGKELLMVSKEQVEIKYSTLFMVFECNIQVMHPIFYVLEPRFREGIIKARPDEPLAI
jgi:hypothetical protein